MGMTLMALQVLLLLGFQAIFGYVYSALAILIGAFMVGLALGSWRSLHRLRRCPDAASETLLRRLGVLQIVAALAPLLLFAVFQTCSTVGSSVGAFLSAHLLFPALALLCGVLGGYQFPVASRVFFSGKESRGPGTLYALDLVGACLGAVLLSGYLVPVFGFLNTSILIGLVNLFPAALTIVTGRQPCLA